MSRTLSCVLLACASLFISVVGLVAPLMGAEADLGPLTMSYEHVAWPALESVLKDLRAADEETRGRALALMGVPQGPGSNDFGAVAETILRYATLGDKETLQAIIGVRQGPMVSGAVATQRDHRWERIAAFSCWCKYERGDLLGEFIRIEPAFGNREELVLRASDGGTGIYSQQEARFSYRRDALHLVFTFVSHRRTCDPTQPFCQVERRWFYVNYWDSVAGGVLVESRFKIFPKVDPKPEFDSVQELEIARAGNFSCKTYRWDQETFRYVAFVAPTNPCKLHLTAK